MMSVSETMMLAVYDRRLGPNYHLAVLSALGILTGCFADERAAIRRAFGGAPAQVASDAGADPPGYYEPSEVKACKAVLAAAEVELNACKGRCAYGSYCCPLASCSTVSIDAWRRQAGTCAEWGVTRPQGEILWPKSTTGETTTVCDAVQPAEEAVAQ